jgi:hypothetical protein
LLTPVILATSEAKIGKIAVPGQLSQKVWETPSQSIAGCFSLAVIPVTVGSLNRRIMVHAVLGKKETASK